MDLLAVLDYQGQVPGEPWKRLSHYFYCGCAGCDQFGGCFDG